MVFGQITYLESLSDTILCLKAKAEKLYQLCLVAFHKCGDINLNRFQCTSGAVDNEQWFTGEVHVYILARIVFKMHRSFTRLTPPSEVVTKARVVVPVREASLILSPQDHSVHADTYQLLLEVWKKRLQVLYTRFSTDGFFCSKSENCSSSMSSRDSVLICKASI
jgi:hypothetical protein